MDALGGAISLSKWFPINGQTSQERDSAPGTPGQLWRPNPTGTILLRLEFPAGAIFWLYLPLRNRKLLSHAGERGGVAG